MIRPSHTVVPAYVPRIDSRPAFGFWLVVTFVAFVCGVLAVILPYQFVLILVAIPVMLVLPWRYPWLGLIVLLAMVSGLLPSPLLGGGIRLVDVFWAYLFLILFFAHLRSDKSWWVGFNPYFRPLSLFFSLAVLSTAYALLILHTPAKHALGEFRHFFYWLLAPMVMVALDSERKLNLFVRTMLILAALLALGVVVQSLTGISILFGGAMNATNTLGVSYQGVIRTQTPGIFLVLFGLFLLTSRYLWQVKKSAAGLPWLMLFGAGIVFTYGRTLWLTSVIGMVYLAFLARGKRMLSLMVFGFIALVIGIGAIWIAKPHTMDAIIVRLESYGTEVSSGQSLEWRYVENRYALIKIRAHPLMGIGLGGNYKPGFAPEAFDGEHRFIHNAYLYLILKMGVLSMLPLAWLYRVIYRRGVRLLKEDESTTKRSIVAASLVVVTIPLITSMTRPEWMTDATIAISAILIGLLGVMDVLRLKGKNRADKLHD